MILKRLIFIFILAIAISGLTANAWLGITITEPSEDTLTELGQNELYGVQILTVEEGSPAALAGVLKDDLIIKINGDKIYTTGQLIKMVKSMEIGNSIDLLVLRDKKETNIKLKLEEKKVKMKSFLGVVVNEPFEDTFEKIGVNYGLEILSIIDDSAAEKAGLESGFVILTINDDKLYTAGQLSKILALIEPEEMISITYFDGEKTKSLKFAIGAQKMNEFSNNEFPFNFFGLPDKLTVLRYEEGFDRLGMKLDDTKSGVKVVEVYEGSIAEEATLEAGDYILKLNGKKIIDSDVFYEVLSDVEDNATVELVIKRGKKKKTLKIKIEERLINRSFDLDIDDNGIRIIIDGKEKILLDQDSFPRLQKYFDDFDVDELIENFKNNLPNDKEIDIKFLKKNTNSERI